MDTKLLTFIEVCRTRNFTSAAKNLNLTQPAVSQHIKLLEAEYDTKLFIRTDNELLLSDEGNIMLKYAKRIQSLYSDLERKIIDCKRYTRSLIVGITHTAESNLTPEILANFSLENSGTHIKIISDTIRKLYDKLNNYQIDLAIIEGKITNKKYSSIVLGSDTLCLVVSPINQLAKKKLVTINDLKKENLIIRDTESGTTALFINELNKLDLSLNDFNVSMEIDNVSSIKDLVMKNLGVSILPRSACLKEIREKSLISLPIENLNMVRETNLVYIKDNIEKETLEKLVDAYSTMLKYKI